MGAHNSSLECATKAEICAIMLLLRCPFLYIKLSQILAENHRATNMYMTYLSGELHSKSDHPISSASQEESFLEPPLQEGGQHDGTGVGELPFPRGAGEVILLDELISFQRW